MISSNRNANLRFSLRDARLASTSIGQRKVAKAIGIDVETLRAYEKGKAVPPDDILKKLLDFYNLPDAITNRLDLGLP